ncbi:Predicted DNA-binding transcriptional regulator YafY, contains an HTH and WYL domains [Cryptosporangium aurantiacum]|uniref:Predicted DNA-binding transcriptional regulator YafY, contains an HTH and WYL domains n=2 Tax=Cryptosporangium aurantiacum TaxID=134849 RepID=A0A1M7RI88_9ACTN|nr:Predicted DNA-binding transcriptional regulator YafY, contains an HTH and WYL domains [Cryptosporangium aurantiacum]
MLLLVQTRGRMTAQELADELEVSVRTVYRDVEALSAAGVPLYADRGPAGGYQLLEGYRTRLTGLTIDQAESLFLVGMPGPAAALGLGTELAAAELKLLAALPAELRTRAERMRERFHLDAPGWFREAEQVPHLAALADAVWNQHRIYARYRRWRAPRDVERVWDPLGLVLKAGVWYFVARKVPGDEIRAYKVSHLLDVEVPGERFARPEGFDLAEYWQKWTSRFERNLIRGEAEVRLSPAGLDRLQHLLGGPAMTQAARANADPPDPDGWFRTTIPVEHIRKAHGDFLALGAEVEVLGPPELRALFVGTARALAALYDQGAPARDERI